MKIKTLFVSLVVIGTLGFPYPVVSADSEDETITDLEPLLYDKLKFKQNTDYLHDEKKIEMKNTIPVKQFDIYFDGRQQLPKRDDTSFLFQTAEREKKSTASAKTSELGLFTDEEKVKKMEAAVQIIEEQATGNTRTIVFLGMIAVGIIILFSFFLPRLVQEPMGGGRKLSK